MWPDRVSNPGPPTYESGALPIALRGPAYEYIVNIIILWKCPYILGQFSGYLIFLRQCKENLRFVFLALGRTHGAPYRGYGYVPLRFGGGGGGHR